MKGASILIVDDEAGLRHGLESLFRREGFTVHTAADFERPWRRPRATPWTWPSWTSACAGGTSGIELLRELKRQEPDLVVIVITGFGSIDTAVTSLKGGAADYFLKPIDNAQAPRRGAQEPRAAGPDRARTASSATSSPAAAPRTSSSPATPPCCALVAKADKVKDNTVTVLITGESGTGKEVLARYIHYTGARRDGAVRLPQLRGAVARACCCPSCSATSGAPSPAPWSASGASSSWPTGARCSSTRSATCRRRSRPSSCACIEESSFERRGRGEAHPGGRAAHRGHQQGPAAP